MFNSNIQITPINFYQSSNYHPSIPRHKITTEKSIKNNGTNNFNIFQIPVYKCKQCTKQTVFKRNIISNKTNSHKKIFRSLRGCFILS